MNLFANNPEFKRYIWTDISTNRILLMTVFTGLIFLLVYLSDNDFTKNLNVASIVLYFFIVIIWGTKEAADSITGDINNRTWNSQKLTLMKPLQMTAGKLFGSTIYQWFGGTICLAVFFLTALFLVNTVELIFIGFSLIFIGIFSHSLAISISLIGISKNTQRAKINSSPYFIISIFIGISAFSRILNVFTYNDNLIYWYSAPYHIAIISFFISLYLAIWGIISIYRNFRTEYKFKNSPVYWLIFIISFMIISAGFNYDMYDNTYLVVLMTLFIPIPLTYFLIIFEPKDIIAYKSIIKFYKEKNFKELLTSLPLWVTTLFVTFLTSIILMFVFPPSVKGTVEFFEFDVNIYFTLNLLLFVIRDIMLFLLMNFMSKKNRADMQSLVILGINYILLPLIFRVVELKTIMAFFIPMQDANLATGTLPVLLEVIVIFYFLRSNFKRIYGDIL